MLSFRQLNLTQQLSQRKRIIEGVSEVEIAKHKNIIIN